MRGNNDSEVWLGGMTQVDVAPSLVVNDETGSLEHLQRAAPGQRRKTRHSQAAPKATVTVSWWTSRSMGIGSPSFSSPSR